MTTGLVFAKAAAGSLGNMRGYAFITKLQHWDSVMKEESNKQVGQAATITIAKRLGPQPTQTLPNIAPREL